MKTTALLLVIVIAGCGEKSKKKSSDDDDDKPSYRAQIAEAEVSLGAIARGAVGAYERETIPSELKEGDALTVAHALCKGATPVPDAIPGKKKYQPSSEPGHDFDSGDAKTGWRCLKFALTNPTQWQYEYRQGGNYKGPSRGGPDPGPDGFEVSAEADLDGDGKKTTLVTRTGKVNKDTMSVTLATDSFTSKE